MTWLAGHWWQILLGWFVLSVPAGLVTGRWLYNASQAGDCAACRMAEQYGDCGDWRRP